MFIVVVDAVRSAQWMHGAVGSSVSRIMQFFSDWQLTSAMCKHIHTLGLSRNWLTASSQPVSVDDKQRRRSHQFANELFKCSMQPSVIFNGWKTKEMSIGQVAKRRSRSQVPSFRMKSFDFLSVLDAAHGCNLLYGSVSNSLSRAPYKLRGNVDECSVFLHFSSTPKSWM